jgi:putative restriction endonuclease
MHDPDADIRLVAFQHLIAARRAQGGALPWSLLVEGFRARGQHFRFASQAEGIFRPVGMSGLLSIKTVVPREGREAWYHDQVQPEVLSQEETLPYAFKGSNPDIAQNRWLKEAMEHKLAIIYFYGVAPGIYEPLFPAFVTDWSTDQLSCSLVVSSSTVGDPLAPLQPVERRYAMRTVHQRLHQSVFRERVLAAYGYRCALSGLPEQRLIDAAHIVPDAHEQLGQPDVRNGICMSKIHHAAYDSGLIGIDPDFTIHVSERLLQLHDGPLLEEAIKRIAGNKIRVPTDTLAAPDRERLAYRYEQFRACA